MQALRDASDERLRHALEARERARDPGADPDALKTSSEAVALALDKQRQVFDLQRTVRPETSVDAFTKHIAEILIELAVELSCCPSADAIMQQRAASERQPALDTITAGRSGDAAKSSIAAALMVLSVLTGICICVRRYCCVGERLRESAAPARKSARRKYAGPVSSHGSPRRLRDEDEDEMEAL